MIILIYKDSCLTSKIAIFEVNLFSDLKFCGFCGVGLTDERAARRAAPTALELDAGYNDFEELFLNWEFFYIAGVV